MLEKTLSVLLESQSLRSPVLKVLPELFAALKRVRGVTEAQSYFAASGAAADITALLPEDSRTPEGLARYLDDSGLKFLQLEKKELSREEILEEFITKRDFEGCLAWFQQHIPGGLEASSEPIYAYVFRLVWSDISAQCYEKRRKVEEAQVKAAVKAASKLLRGLLDESLELQTLALDSLHAFWRESRFEGRDDFLKEMFAYFYDEEAISEDAYLAWRDKASQGTSRFRDGYQAVRTWLEWLCVAEEDEGGADK